MAKKKVPEVPTLSALADAFIQSIQMGGRSGGTAASYAADLRVALKFLGAETDLRNLTPTRVGEFFEAPVVTKRRDGEPKNPISVAKTRRILRLALVWAVQSNWLDVAPLPPKAPEVSTDAPTATPAETAAVLPDEAHVETSAPEAASEPIADAAPQGPGFDHELMAEDDADRAKRNAKTAKVAKAAKSSKKKAAAAK